MSTPKILRKLIVDYVIGTGNSLIHALDLGHFFNNLQILKFAHVYLKKNPGSQTVPYPILEYVWIIKCVTKLGVQLFQYYSKRRRCSFFEIQIGALKNYKSITHSQRQYDNMV